MTLIGILTAAFIGMASSAAAFGCAKNEPSSTQSPSLQGPSSGGAEALAEQGGEPGAGQSSYEEPEFKLSLQPVGSYTANQSGTAQIVLEAKSGFKCNDKYPYKYKLEKTEGVRFESDVVRQENVEVTNAKSVMKVSFLPESAGAKRLAGTFYFSVCTEDKCLVERRKLSLDIAVSGS